MATRRIPRMSSVVDDGGYALGGGRALLVGLAASLPLWLVLVAGAQYLLERMG